MTNNYLHPMLLCDGYKLGHKEFEVEGTNYKYATFTPRSNKYFPRTDKVLVFGIQVMIKKWLIEYFNDEFFNKDIDELVDSYVEIVKAYLGEDEVRIDHIIELHSLGYLPIKIKALKEGTLSPFKVPVLTIENTHPNFAWLPTYLETLISTEIWQPITSATIANEYRKLADKYALETTGSIDGVDWQIHDFSMRGMSSVDTATTSAMAHLIPNRGTDTLAGIQGLVKYYNADIKNELIGGSIYATEHSIMSQLTPADGNRDEYNAYKHIITKVRPNGIVAVVSDTYDFWKVVTETLPSLRKEIMKRDGKLVIRPDSGDPVEIICGTSYQIGSKFAETKGLIENLWDTFGGTVNDKGFKVLDPHIGAIYGEAITLDRAEEIFDRLKAKGFASTNIVFGIGSYTYNTVSRDTLGQAMKATYSEINNEPVMMFKDPKTDDGTKRSQRGKVRVFKEDRIIKYVDGLTNNSDESEENLLVPVFENGKLLIEQSLSGIREKLANN